MPPQKASISQRRYINKRLTRQHPVNKSSKAVQEMSGTEPMLDLFSTYTRCGVISGEVYMHICVYIYIYMYNYTDCKHVYIAQR